MIRTILVAMMLLTAPVLVLGEPSTDTPAEAVGRLLDAVTDSGVVKQAPEIKEGVQYEVVVPEMPGAEGKRIQVMEFFWYGCGHCFAFEPHLEKWLEQKPDDVDFVRVPAMFNRPDVILHAKVFYTLNLIGADPSIHSKIFDAMNVQHKRLGTETEMEEFLQANGIDMFKFRDAIKSFSVGNSIRKAAILAEDYDIRGVPAMTVDGKYKFGGLEGDLMIDVLNHLVEKVRKDKAVVGDKK